MEGIKGAQICDVVVKNGGMANGEARHVLVAQELILENAWCAVVEDCERCHVAEVVVVDSQHVEKKAAAASTVLQRGGKRP